MTDFRRSTIVLLIVRCQAASLPRRSAAATPPPGSGRGRPGRQEQSGKRGPGVLSLLPADSVTEHSIDLPSGKLAYTATAGTLSLFDQSGERSAAIFYTAFVAKTGRSAARR